MSSPSAPSLATAIRDSLAAPTTNARAKALLEVWKSTRIARALARYNGANGPLLSSGTALGSLLALTAALTLAITVFMAFLGGNGELRDAFIATIAQAVPSLLATEADPDGLVSPESLEMSGALSLTGVVALAIMAWTAIGVVGRLGASIREMFAIPVVPGNPVAQIARNALGVLGLGASLVLGAGLGIVLDLAADRFLDLLGLEPSAASRIVLQGIGLLLATAVYALVAWLLIEVVARAKPPRRDLAIGCALIALASIILRMLGTSAVGAAKGPLLATAAAIIALVAWLNLQIRAMLALCAWIANPPAPATPASAREVHFLERPNYVTLSAPATLEWPHNPVTGEVRPDPLHNLSSRMLGADWRPPPDEFEPRFPDRLSRPALAGGGTLLQADDGRVPPLLARRPLRRGLRRPPPRQGDAERPRGPADGRNPLPRREAHAPR